MELFFTLEQHRRDFDLTYVLLKNPIKRHKKKHCKHVNIFSNKNAEHLT